MISSKCVLVYYRRSGGILRTFKRGGFRVHFLKLNSDIIDDQKTGNHEEG